jgi:hypothetical protein
MQMRKIWGVMLDKDFDPRAIADSWPMPFKKSMEGAGTDTPAERLDAGAASESKAAWTDATPSKRNRRPAKS